MKDSFYHKVVCRKGGPKHWNAYLTSEFSKSYSAIGFGSTAELAIKDLQKQLRARYSLLNCSFRKK